MSRPMLKTMSLMLCCAYLGAAVPAEAHSEPSAITSAGILVRQQLEISGTKVKVPELEAGLGDSQSARQIQKPYQLAQENVPYFFWDRATEQKAPTMEMGRSSAVATTGQYCRTKITRCELEQPALLHSDCSCGGSHSTPQGYVTP